ncbi:MAG: NifB/NifX family molybdenum-iron cluster-binding protein [Desulfuromonadaceae bacterium]|nr:NifB/NifX family molybdenum-iron cluster-binding protein [Desulfuromonadaceae bacterium]
MKIAVSATESTLSTPIDSRFGRAKQFLIVDTDSNALAVLPNTQNLNAAQGAGIQAAQNVVNAGVQAVITGNCGPKAFRVLKAAGIAIYHCSDRSAGDAIKAILSGTLQPAESANAESHWS